MAPPTFGPPPPDHPPPPGAGEVHLWAIALDPPETREAALWRHLAPDEVERADRFRFERHRRRYGVGRGALRELLAGYLGTAPAAVAFRYGDKGKPFLAGPGSDFGGLEFNLSNSHELALVAVATGLEVGVDVEHLRPMDDALSISERFFSRAEREALAAVPEGERDLAFFRCWTRKEAYLKAVGDGITVPLDRFDVTLAAQEPARFLALDGDPARAAGWSLVHLEPAPGYVGAFAAPRPGPWAIAAWRWR